MHVTHLHPPNLRHVRPTRSRLSHWIESCAGTHVVAPQEIIVGSPWLPGSWHGKSEAARCRRSRLLCWPTHLCSSAGTTEPSSSIGLDSVQVWLLQPADCILFLWIYDDILCFPIMQRELTRQTNCFRSTLFVHERKMHPDSLRHIPMLHPS
jgi:hypothetical protein